MKFKTRLLCNLCIKFPAPYIGSIHIQRLQILGPSEDLNHPSFVNKPDKQSCLLCLEKDNTRCAFWEIETIYIIENFMVGTKHATSIHIHV